MGGPKVEKSGGGEIPDDYREILPSGQQKAYIVLAPEERAKGYIRPLRQTYRHLACDSVTTMKFDIAETYARDPTFYTGTFCVACAKHFPLDQFVWEGTNEKVGS